MIGVDQSFYQERSFVKRVIQRISNFYVLVAEVHDRHAGVVDKILVITTSGGRGQVWIVVR